MQRLEVSCAVRPIYGSLGAKGLMCLCAGRFITLKETHYALSVLKLFVYNALTLFSAYNI
jgi:hypothetical protein